MKRLRPGAALSSQTPLVTLERVRDDNLPQGSQGGGWSTAKSDGKRPVLPSALSNSGSANRGAPPPACRADNPPLHAPPGATTPRAGLATAASAPEKQPWAWIPVRRVAESRIPFAAGFSSSRRATAISAFFERNHHPEPNVAFGHISPPGAGQAV